MTIKNFRARFNNVHNNVIAYVIACLVAMNQTNVKFGMTKKTIETALCLSRLSEMNVTASDLSTIES